MMKAAHEEAATAELFASVFLSCDSTSPELTRTAYEIIAVRRPRGG